MLWKKRRTRVDNAPLCEEARAIQVSLSHVQQYQHSFRVVLGELWLTMDHCSVISKKEILYLGPFGLACWLWGTVFINRGNVEESRQTINATAESIRLKKVILIRFPALLITQPGKTQKGVQTESNFSAEAPSVSRGTPSLEQHVTSLQERRFSRRDRIANADSARCRVEVLFPEKRQMQAIPFRWATISNCDSHETRLSGAYLRRRLCTSGNSYITILPPIPTAGMTKDDLPKLMEQTYKVMNKTFVESTRECFADHIGSLKEE